MARAHAYQLTMEDDLHLRPAAFARMLDGACAVLARHPTTSIVQLSQYTEVLLTSLAGARALLSMLETKGIVRATDQQLLTPRFMHPTRHSVRKYHEHFRWPTRPWVLGRAPNAANGFIWRTRRMTWAECSLLRLLTMPGARALPMHGAGVGRSGTWAA